MSASASPAGRSDLIGSTPSGGPLRSLRDAAGTVLRRIRPTPRAVRHVAHYEGVLGTALELQVVATDRAAALRAESLVLAEIDRLERILSTYSATSELSSWLRTCGADVPVSPELAEVLDLAERWRVCTNGAFDPAAVSLVELLRDGPASWCSDAGARQRALYARREELNRPLWTLDRDRGSARRLTRLDVSLDALAKGYIVDRAANSARAAEGVCQVLVNIGGDLRHHGSRAIAVAVTDPHAPADNASSLAVVRLRDEALATSGGYHRGFVANGRRVSHIIDPRTGESAESVASASVIAPDCATADALSTAFSVMPPRESVALADSLPGVGCLIVERDGTLTSNALWNSRAAAPRDTHTFEEPT
jgi:FAD:protein FMN transferase